MLGAGSHLPNEEKQRALAVHRSARSSSRVWEAWGQWSLGRVLGTQPKCGRQNPLPTLGRGHPYWEVDGSAQGGGLLGVGIWLWEHSAQLRGGPAGGGQ